MQQIEYTKEELEEIFHEIDRKTDEHLRNEWRLSKHACKDVFVSETTLRQTLREKALEEMPLLVNSPDPRIRFIAEWRLKHSK